MKVVCKNTKVLRIALNFLLNLSIKSVDSHLFVSPLRPKVPGHGRSNAQEDKDDSQPEEAFPKVEFLVEDVADSVDRALAGVLLRRLRQGCFFWCLLHTRFFFYHLSLTKQNITIIKISNRFFSHQGSHKTVILTMKLGAAPSALTKTIRKCENFDPFFNCEL